MAKIQKTLRLSEEVINMIAEVADDGFHDSWTSALESMIKHSHLVRSVPIDDRDQLRVSCRRGPYDEVYEKHERKMIDFFHV